MAQKSALVIGVIVVVAIVFGGMLLMNNDESETKTDNQVTTSQTPASSEMTSLKNIVATAGETPSLSTLVTAVKAADLVETLSNPEANFTVFAPTNTAFSALPAGTLDGLLKPENKSDLAKVLTYHVVAGEAMAADLTDGQKLKTVQGQELTVKIMSGKVYINDALVSMADVKTSNGVVHVIDSVLLPQ